MTQLYISPSNKAYTNYIAVSGIARVNCLHVKDIADLNGYHPEQVKVIRGLGFKTMSEDIRMKARQLDSRVLGMGQGL